MYGYPQRGGSRGGRLPVDQMINLKFSRSDELEADSLGVKYMAQAGYDPRSMIEVMKLLEASAGPNQQPEFMSTHPDPGNHIPRIEEVIQRVYPNGVPAGLKE